MIICPECNQEAQSNSPDLWKNQEDGWWNDLSLVDCYCKHCHCFWNSKVSNMLIFPEDDGISIRIISLKIEKEETDE